MRRYSHIHYGAIDRRSGHRSQHPTLAPYCRKMWSQFAGRSGLNEALRTSPVWAFRRAISVPFWASHTRAVLSLDAVTIRRPSGLKEALHTSYVGHSDRLFLAPLGIPYPCCLIVRPGHDPPAIGAERWRPVLYGPQTGDLCSALRIPHPRRVIQGPGHDLPTFGTERSTGTHGRSDRLS